MSKPRLPRGIANNNPGNIEKGEAWQGLASLAEMTPEQRGEMRFAVFKSPEWGIRAMARLLLKYRDAYGLRTVSGIIGRWAPPTENDTGAYALAVASEVGVSPTDTLDLDDPETMRRLLSAIIRHENGQQPYPDEVIERGIALATGADMPAPIERKDTMSPFLVAALPALVEAIPGLIRTFGKGEVTERNAQAAERVLQIAQAATGTTNAQAAVEAVKGDPAARIAATEALDREGWFVVTEAGGGGIEGARQFSIDTRGAFWNLPAFWISLLLMLPLYAVVFAVLFGDGWEPTIRVQVVTAILAVISIVGAFWLGSSYGSQRKDTILRQ